MTVKGIRHFFEHVDSECIFLASVVLGAGPESSSQGLTLALNWRAQVELSGVGMDVRMDRWEIVSCDFL